MAQLVLMPLKKSEYVGVNRVPLDFTPALPESTDFDKIVIRVGHMPYGASLSRGRNNGDKSWTLSAEHAAGLYYIPARTNFEPHWLRIWIIGIIDDEEATVLDQFECRVTADGKTPEMLNTSGQSVMRRVVPFGKVKACNDGLSLATRSAAAHAREDRNLVSLQSFFEVRFGEVAQRLEDAETQIVQLHATLSEYKTALSVYPSGHDAEPVTQKEDAEIVAFRAAVPKLARDPMEIAIVD